jgi:hypothetical protein
LGTIGFEPLISRCTDETTILAANPAYAMIYVENLAFFLPVFSFLFFLYHQFTEALICYCTFLWFSSFIILHRPLKVRYISIRNLKLSARTNYANPEAKNANVNFQGGGVSTFQNLQVKNHCGERWIGAWLIGKTEPYRPSVGGHEWKPPHWFSEWIQVHCGHACQTLT